VRSRHAPRERCLRENRGPSPDRSCRPPVRDRDDLLIRLSGLTAAEVSRAKFGRRMVAIAAVVLRSEAAVGQLYPATLLASLVTLEVGRRGNSPVWRDSPVRKRTLIVAAASRLVTCSNVRHLVFPTTRNHSRPKPD
jgi:hypothetical protein